MNWDDRIRDLGQEHGFDVDATEFMARVIQRAGGNLATWDHPKLGGLGEWIPGTTILHPRDREKEKRLDELCLGLLGLLKEDGHDTQPGTGADLWWPKDIGLSPDAAGAQGQVRYAYFADTRRLAVDHGDGKVTVHDTGDHRVRGVSQRAGRLVFQSQHGEVDLETLTRVEPPER